MLLAGSSFAHHSYVAEFDADSPTTIEGVVREVWFKNPHVRYYVTVTSEDGEEVVWDTRGFNGEPVGENTRVTERYFLTNNGQRLNMIMVQHDPDNYHRPPIRRRAWDKNHDSLIFPFECDPDSFFRQLFSEGRMQEYIDRSYRRP